VQRILVIGCSGGGKSTLARKLGQRLDIPVIPLDSIWWQPGWVPLGHEKLRPLVEKMVAEESWIIDGNFPDTFPKRLARADTVIWIDRPRLVNFARAFGRFLKLRGTVREEMGEGCPEKFDLEFARYIWTYNREVAPRMAALIRQHGSHTEVVRLRKDSEIAEFLEAI
jgi:adenylate kinase family enzyme